MARAGLVAQKQAKTVQAQIGKGHVMVAVKRIKSLPRAQQEAGPLGQKRGFPRWSLAA
jgi:hypothetical protein